MSLVCCVKTSHGIVMSADRRISFDYTVNAKASIKLIRRKVITDQERKIFPVGPYGISFYGDSGPVPMSALLERTISTIDASKDLDTVSELIMQGVAQQLQPRTHASFYLCGYDVSSPDGKILHCQLNGGSISTMCCKGTVIVGGDLPPFIDDLINSGLDFSQIPIKEAKSYLTFLTYTAATYQKYSSLPETISPGSDFLVLRHP